MYLLKLALRPWKIAPMTQVVSTIAVGCLLLMAAFLFWMERGLKPVVSRLQHEQVITAYLDSVIVPQDEGKVVDSIRVAVGAQAIDVQLVGPQKFLENLKEHYPDLSQELENLGGEMNSIIPRYVSISGILPSHALERVKAVHGVESAESSGDRYTHIVGAFRALRWMARLLAAGLGFALLTGFVQLTRMNSYLHQDVIQLLRLWGAGPWALRVPALLSNLGVGLAGGAISAVGWFLGGSWLASHIRNLSPILKDMPLPNTQIMLFLLLAGAAAGFFSMLISTYPKEAG